jgi:hypothetical protein
MIAGDFPEKGEPMKTVAGLFKSEREADLAIKELERAGFNENNYGVIAPNTVVQRVDRAQDQREGTIQTDHKLGTAGGAAVGGLTGLLAGLTALAVPGVGPILAAGMIAASAGFGATAGGLLGSLTSASINEEEAQTYAEGVKRGGILVIVQADDRRAVEAQNILRQAGALEIEAHRKEWEAAGWTGFNQDILPNEKYPKL